MDHSIFGYLTRRNAEELRQIIALCQAESDNEDYAEIQAFAQKLLALQQSGDQ